MSPAHKGKDDIEIPADRLFAFLLAALEVPLNDGTFDLCGRRGRREREDRERTRERGKQTDRQTDRQTMKIPTGSPSIFKLLYAV